MRNDARDELDDVPSLGMAGERDVESARHEPPRRSAAGTGILWSVIAALLISFGVLGWWSFQQIGLLNMRLVATQESFARISEDAAGRLQDISGKVVATESSVNSESEALKLRIKQLESQVLEIAQQQQALATEQKSLQGRQGNHDQRLQEQERGLSAGGERQQALDASLRSLQGEQKALQETLAQASRTLDEQARSLAAQKDNATALESLGKEVGALKARGNPAQAISRLEQDLLVLRSELENRPASAQGVDIAEFDAFRAQVTRNINTLQSQLANLQGQLNAR
ncbi:ATPase [Stutzerimonas kirkiae]|uniref:ATPase n=1 Tax=Stutzerimonas kirkiae TaxID=2211392 RepID=A0A4Q9R2D5_9GAMM|nr:ATPase [Stutzerimonas kirkiae]TBU92185.1 ATPase [Stutzerimonas kirkiae]TBV01165.1 ATPase [Stutzerimonas kirkiae]TBV10468.1 ATPase [Stutzerimonas kirkiae]TBV13976.1 ATPase [Stutzerimonas kirkiae]